MFSKSVIFVILFSLAKGFNSKGLTCNSVELDNCYRLKDIIEIDISDFCIPRGEELVVYACFSERNKCFQVDGVVQNRTILHVKIEKPFQEDYAYSLRFLTCEGYFIGETDKFLVSSKKCCSFCTERKFLAKSPIQACYNYGDTLSFKYQALCFPSKEEILIWICSSRKLCSVVTSVPSDLTCGEISLKVEEPNFQIGAEHIIYVFHFPNIYMKSITFTVSSKNSSCYNYKKYPKF